MNENIKKQIQVMELYSYVSGLDIIVQKFFDLDSEKDLDLKIEVLTKLKDGIPPAEIPEYYSILELYPEDDVIWD